MRQHLSAAPGQGGGGARHRRAARNYRKVQIGFSQPQEDTIFEHVPVVGVWHSGNVFNLTLKGKEEDFMPQLEALQPAFISAMPLTLEEVFISEMEAAGYDANHIC